MSFRLFTVLIGFCVKRMTKPSLGRESIHTAQSREKLWYAISYECVWTVTQSPKVKFELKILCNGWKKVQQFFFFLYYICNYLYKASTCIIIFHLKIFLHNEGDKLDTLVDISRHFAFQVPNSISPCNFLCGNM